MKNMSRTNFDEGTGKKSKNVKCPTKIGTVGNPDENPKKISEK
jgi:hypothetical protein